MKSADLVQVLSKLSEASKALKLLQENPNPAWESVSYPTLNDDMELDPIDLAKALDHLGNEIGLDFNQIVADEEEEE